MIIFDLELIEIWHETETCLSWKEKNLQAQEFKICLSTKEHKTKKIFVGGRSQNEFFYYKKKAHLMFSSPSQNCVKVTNQKYNIWALHA